MTTRHIIKDGRTFLAGYCGGGGPVGTYFELNAVGDDNPLNDRKSENAYSFDLLASNNPAIAWRQPQWDTEFKSGNWNSCFGGFMDDGVYLEFDSNDEIRLINKLASNIRSHDFNLAIFIGEGKQSLNMLATRSAQLGRSIRALRKGNIPLFVSELGVNVKPKKAPKSRLLRHARGIEQPTKSGRLKSTTLADRNNAWLEFEFGVRPLMSDIYESSQAVFALTNRPLSRCFRARIYRGEDMGPLSVADASTGKRYTEKQIRVVLAEDYSPKASLGLTDPASLIWELTPWSFVVDWVIPIGSYLRARSFLNNVKLREGFTTYWQEYDRTRNSVPTYEIVGLPNFVKRRRLRRVPYAGSSVLPSPKLRKTSEIFDWKHAIDGVSLILQQKWK